MDKVPNEVWVKIFHRVLQPCSLLDFRDDRTNLWVKRPAVLVLGSVCRKWSVVASMLKYWQDFNYWNWAASHDRLLWRWNEAHDAERSMELSTDGPCLNLLATHPVRLRQLRELVVAFNVSWIHAWKAPIESEKLLLQMLKMEVYGAPLDMIKLCAKKKAIGELPYLERVIVLVRRQYEHLPQVQQRIAQIEDECRERLPVVIQKLYTFI